MTEYSLRHRSLATELVGSEEHGVASFKGIPYASVSRRWQKSVPRESLGEKWDSRSFGPKCPQPDWANNTNDFGPHIPFPDVEISEFDCLNLNVTCPVERPEDKHPVMVWIHGGSLSFGANSDPIWDPTLWVQETVREGRPMVVVSISYRLGPFGFLAPEADSPGNFGFHDQVLALQWVQKHIGEFGGDASRITIAGESAGGCSVHAHLAYQTSRDTNLFNRAIMQSGNLAVMGFWTRQRMDEIVSAAMQEAGISMEQREDAVEALRNLAPEEMLELPSLKIDGFGIFCDGVFVAEPLVGPRGELLSATPKVEAFMHGDNADEGNIFRQAAAPQDAAQALESVAAAVLGSAGKDRLLAMYGLAAWRDLDDDSRADRLHRFPEDARFYLPSDCLQSACPSAAFYHLAAKSPFSSSLYPKDSFHTLDLLYLFANFDRFLQQEDKQEDLALGKRMRTAWLDFVYGKDPWEGAFTQTCATFDRGKDCFGRMNAARGWDAARQARMKVLQELGFDKIVEVATKVFP